MELHLTAMECHLPYAITQCFTCHPTQVNTPHLNPSQIGQSSIYLPWRDGRLSWLRCFHLQRDAHSLKQERLQCLTETVWCVTYGSCSNQQRFQSSGHSKHTATLQANQGSQLPFTAIHILSLLTGHETTHCTYMTVQVVPCPLILSATELTTTTMNW